MSRSRPAIPDGRRCIHCLGSGWVLDGAGTPSEGWSECDACLGTGERQADTRPIEQEGTDA